MGQPEQIIPPSLNFAYKNRASGHFTSHPLTNPNDYASVDTLDVRLTNISKGKLATAVATGSTTTAIILNGEAFRLSVGLGIEIRDSTDTAKAGATGKTITNIQADTPTVGLTTVTFTTAASGNVVATDYIKVTNNPYAGSYSSRQLSKMTINDKIFAVRKVDDPNSF